MIVHVIIPHSPQDVLADTLPIVTSLQMASTDRVMSIRFRIAEKLRILTVPFTDLRNVIPIPNPVHMARGVVGGKSLMKLGLDEELPLRSMRLDSGGTLTLNAMVRRDEYSAALHSSMSPTNGPIMGLSDRSVNVDIESDRIAYEWAPGRELLVYNCVDDCRSQFSTELAGDDAANLLVLLKVCCDSGWEIGTAVWALLQKLAPSTHILSQFVDPAVVNWVVVVHNPSVPPSVTAYTLQCLQVYVTPPQATDIWPSHLSHSQWVHSFVR